MTKIILAVLAAVPIALGGVSVAVAVAEEPNTAVTEAPKAAVAGDVIARVGDRALGLGRAAHR